VVQLGAYKEAGNVKLLLSKLKGINVPAYTEKLESPQGPRTRVRAGPFREPGSGGKGAFEDQDHWRRRSGRAKVRR
jgi:DedD protein